MLRSSEPWKPHGYQLEGVEHLCGKRVAALFWEPGCGKTTTTLAAFSRLVESGQATKMLVIAPLRVCQLVWEQEAKRWDQFRNLRFSFLHGPDKDKRLAEDADIYLINCEGVTWLAKKFWNQRLPFDVVAVDELTKFKNQQARRSKALLPHMQRMPFKWGLTGTPIPNGYMDLFGQMLLLDGGAALGRYITHYRDMYFDKGWDGFTYVLRRGADKLIEARVAPYVHRVEASKLPPLITDVRRTELPAGAKKLYARIVKDMLLELPEGGVTAANAAALYSKLKQLANGAVYLSDTGTPLEEGVTQKYAVLHDAKLDMLDELVEEMAGQPLLIGYQFKHDLARMRERFGERLTYIRSGATTKEVEVIEQAWNRGQIQCLAAHPASVGHGLNLQLGGACHVCWFSVTTNYEHYDQFLRRILRQGNSAEHVVNHILVVEDTYDEADLAAVQSKGERERTFLQGVKEYLRKADTEAVRNAADTKETKMVKKLGFGRSAVVEEDDEEDDLEPVVQKGLRHSVSPEPAEDEDEDEEEDEAAQRRAIRNKLRARLSKSEGEGEDEGEDEDEDEDSPATIASKLLRNTTARLVETQAVGAEIDKPAPRRAPRKTSEPETVASPEPLPENSGPGQLSSFADLLEALAAVIRKAS